MTARTPIHQLQVATELYQFIQDQVLPGTGVDSARFWSGFDAIVRDLAPRNAALLKERDRLQTELDAWHQAHPGPIRNQQMLDEGKPTEGLAFHPDADVKSGTGDMVARLRKAGIPVQWFTE